MNIRSLLFKTILSISFTLSLTAFAQPHPPQPRHPRIPPQPPKQKKHTGPWNNDLYLYTSTDGIHFTKQKLFVERAGVPTMTKLKDKTSGKPYLLAAFQWFPFDQKESFDKIAVMKSFDEGKTWSKPKTITINGFPENLMRAFDPTLVTLDDSTARLYFTSKPTTGKPEDKIINQGSPPRIYSAKTTDGVHYTFEPGVRFEVPNEMVIDCAVVYDKKMFHLYSPVQKQRGKAYYATSSDGLNFSRMKNIDHKEVEHWLGNVINNNDIFRFYLTGKNSLFQSKNGKDWQVVPTAAGIGADPGVVKTNDNLYLLISIQKRQDFRKNPPHLQK